MIPLLIKPRLLSLKNRWRGSGTVKRRIGADLIVVILAVVMAWMIYSGTSWALLKIKEAVEIAYLPTAYPIGLVLMALMVMLLISAVVITLSVLLFGHDLDFLLAAPLKPHTFFCGKFILILLSSSWMPIVFVVPFLAAFGMVYQAGLSYYLTALLVLIPYFCLPISVAIVAVLIFTLLLPIQRTQPVFWACLLILGYAIITAINAVGSADPDAAGQLVKLMSILRLLAMPQYDWLPSNWVARVLQHALEPGSNGVVSEVILLYSVVLAFSSTGYLIVSNWHELAYSRAFNQGRRSRCASIDSPSFSKVSWIVAPIKAVIGKELKTFVRETSQMLQLLVLTGIGLLYLYNLHILSNTEAVGELIAGVAWRSFVFVINSSISAFIVTAICTRLVFPSISLEGRAIWIIEQSPLSQKQLLVAKFWVWLVPVVVVSWGMSAIGTYMVAPSGAVLLISSYSALCTAVGIVGLAVGLGAVFCDFEWEHPSQLQASFGSLVFMLLCVGVIMINQIPTALLITVAHSRSTTIFSVDASLVFLLSALFLGLSNLYCAFFALRVGQKVLTSA